MYIFIRPLSLPSSVCLTIYDYPHSLRVIRERERGKLPPNNERFYPFKIPFERFTPRFHRLAVSTYTYSIIMGFALISHDSNEVVKEKTLEL
jgi:hypothetical protein